MRQMILCAVIVSCSVGETKAAIELDIDSYLTPTVTSPALETFHQYLIEVSGTFTGDTQGSPVDAEWLWDGQNWVEYGYDPDQPGVDMMDLLLNETNVDWLGTEDGVYFLPHTYSPSHVYRYLLIGQGAPISFRIEDGAGARTYDNRGSLHATITDKGVVPEPSSIIVWSLMGLTFFGSGFWRRRKGKGK